MTTKFSYAIITGGVLFGLSGCGGSGGGATHTTTPIISNGATQPAVTTTTKSNTQNITTNTGANAKPTAPTNTTTGTSKPNTQNTTTKPTTNTGANAKPTAPTNTTTGTGATSPVIFTATSATAFIANTNDSKALNITRVVRPTGNFAKEAQEVVKYTNQLRAEKGLPALQYDENLSAFAQMRASEYEIAILRANGDSALRRKIAHQRLDGSSYSEGVTGYGSLGENLAFGYESGREVVIEGWRNSAGHYANIINDSYERIGIGVVHVPSTQGYYWVQIFGSDTIAYPYEFVDGGKDNPEPLKQVVIDGRTIPLDPLNRGQWQAINVNGRNQGQFTGYDYTRFGVVAPTNANQTHLFYQGTQTADHAIPKSGTANYRGTALIIKDGKTNTDINSQFTANFDTRKLNGKLTQNNTTLYNLSADINGSAFASKAETEVQTQGAFFGNNAEELAGVFKDTKTDAKGVFGAKK